MKAAVAAGLVVAITLLGGFLPAAKGIASDARQVDPHTQIEQIRARRHLHTSDVGTLRGDEEDQNSAEPAVDIPKELAPFIRGGEIPVYFDTADLEETGRLDYVLVVGTHYGGGRVLRILSRSASGGLSVVLARTDAVQCDGCGGMDEKTSIGVGKGAIELHQISGSAAGGTAITCLFRYSRASRQWLLVDLISFDWTNSPPEGESPTSVQHQTTKDLGAVSLASADLASHCQ